MQYTLLATTVGRTGERTWARGSEDQGYLMGLALDTDCENLEVQFQTRLPNLKVSPILRFGGKGIALWDDGIAVAAYDNICRYDRASGLLMKQFSHRFYTEKDLDLFHFNHHFFVDGDLVVNVPPAGRLWNVSKRDWFLDEFCLGPGWDGAFHDGVYLAEQGLYVNYTQQGTVNKHDPHTGRLMASIPAVPSNDWTVHHTIGWLRGLCHLDHERFLVGQAGPHLLLVDFAENRVVREWSLGQELKHTFFALFETTNVAQSPAGLRVAVLER